MKVTEETAVTRNIRFPWKDDFEPVLALGPIQFTWGGEPFEPKEIVVDFSRELSGTMDVKITDEEIQTLWDLST